MLFKILGLGFLFNKKAYLRDPWNILDFIIVVSAYIPLVINSEGVNLSVLRSLRVLRPLRTISSIKALKVLIKTLFDSFGLLLQTFMILVFF